MALESQPNGRQTLTLQAEPMPGSKADPPKAANYEFAPEKGRISTIEEMATTLTGHKVPAMLGVNE